MLVYEHYLERYERYLREMRSQVSAFDGAAGLFDFAGALAPRIDPADMSARNDAKAIASDWEAVGDALRSALGIVRRSRPDEE